MISLGAEPRYGAFYGEGARPIIVADLSCSGTENDVLSCERNVFGITHCQEYEEAGVKCLGMLKSGANYIIGLIFIACLMLAFHCEFNNCICCQWDGLLLMQPNNVKSRLNRLSSRFYLKQSL